MPGTMALDEVTEKLYRETDTSTLLALLPLLQSHRERASAEMKHFQRAGQELTDRDAELAENYGELLATLDAQVGDDPKGREALDDLRPPRQSRLIRQVLLRDSQSAK